MTKIKELNTTMCYDNSIDYLLDKEIEELEKQNLRKFKKYILEDSNGNILATGRYNEVMNVSYPRYVYRHIFDDVLYWDGTYIDKYGRDF